jgi:hypothetical protein
LEEKGKEKRNKRVFKTFHNILLVIWDLELISLPNIFSTLEHPRWSGV